MRVAGKRGPMGLGGRLKRLQARVGAATPAPAFDLHAAAARWGAYLRGQGPRPPDRPCPPGLAPEAWAGRMLAVRCVEERLLGRLAEGEYLPGLTDAER